MSPKVAVNPLQFVKVGPCDLYRSAQEQLKKVEEIKKAKKEHKDEAEDWQSNLDNWKCSRRKRQEHIIERVVEVKKLELEEHERNRRRSKTFSEMMQERNTRGRKSSLPVWNDDSDDLSELGLKNKNDSSSEAEKDKDANDNSEQESSLSSSEVNEDYDKCKADIDEVDEMCKEKSNVKSLPEPEEYTYERAIQSYVNFAETRVKSRSSKSMDEDSKGTKKECPPIPAKPKRNSITKIDTYISQIELNKNKPIGDSTEQTKKAVALPKVDVNKRRELFEKIKGEDTGKTNKTADVPTSKSIKERLSSLEKHQDNIESSRNNVNSTVNCRQGIKERLSNIEKISSSSKFVLRRSSEPLSSQSIKERLSSFEKSKISPPKLQSVVEPTVSIKERLNSLHSSCEKEPAKTIIPSIDPSFNEKLSNFKGVSSNSSYQNRAFSPDEIYKRDQHYRHRSLDSLDINQESMSNGSFERVQSLEDLDYRNYPASTFSGDTDREDSGIHTADVSSSVSQADDYDLHLDGNILDDIKMNHQPPIEEETKVSKCELYNEEPLKNVSDGSGRIAKSLTPDSSFYDALPPILENPLEPLTTSSPLVEESLVNSYQPSPPASPYSRYNNNIHVPEDETREPVTYYPELSGRDDSTNQITSNSENYHGDVDASTMYRTESKKEMKDEVCLKTVVNEPNPSNGLVSLPASFSGKSEETPEVTNQEKPKEFESVISKPDVISEFESEDTTVDVMPSQVQIMATPTSEYKIDQQISNALSYEKLDINVPIINQLTEIIVQSDPSCLFPLSSTALEPPKEKPPPPPMENSDDESDKATHKTKSLRRLDSTKRIKKELRQKRSSFLGLESNDDDSYLEPELVRPPDLSALLAEERRLERQLYRQSVCSESDSNQESRDSGVELDHKHNEMWSHSRNDSETFGNHSTTSEEDEIMKKEREIIETLEQEEKNRKQDLGEKLAMRLRELEAEKERIEWEHAQVDPPTNGQNHPFLKHNHISVEDLNKCRNQEEMDTEWCTPRSSLQDLTVAGAHHDPSMLNYRGEYRKSLGDLSTHRHQSNVRYAGHRRSMPNLQDVIQRRPPPPPPPVLPVKSIQHSHPPKIQQSFLQHTQVLPQTRVVNPPPQIANLHTTSNGNNQTSRPTLHALSAAPRSRLISADSWQVRKKHQRPGDSYNYQHWLIQEAEHRRITEQHERSAVKRPDGSRHGGWPTTTPAAQQQQWNQQARGKPLPDSIIQTLTQRVQSRLSDPNNNRRRQEVISDGPYQSPQNDSAKEKMLSVSGKKRCSHCGEELGRGAAMIIESLQLFYHIDCFKCCVCCIQLGDGLNGTDVRVRNNKLHCHNCYSSDDGAKFSCV